MPTGELFKPLQSRAIPRRAFLVALVAFAGIVAALWRRKRPLPDPAQNGTGPHVTIVLFTDQGARLTAVRVGTLVKSDAAWRKSLWPEEYLSARKGGTETAYTGRYWNSKEPGVYRCVCCGSALFRSLEKFDSQTGWPSFWAPIAGENVWTAEDRSLGLVRTEALCTKCDAHLGHVFDDGPQPTGLRYCINSIALRLLHA